MKLLIESVMIFLGTLLAAALVALGAPGEPQAAHVEQAFTGAVAKLQKGVVAVASAWSAMPDTSATR